MGLNSFSDLILGQLLINTVTAEVEASTHVSGKRYASVSQLPFPDDIFDLATAVETHFWWPNLPGGVHEIFRVTKPGGTLILMVEIYKGARTSAAKFAEKYASRVGMTLLSAEEHCDLCTNAGFSDVQIIEDHDKGWLTCIARKPTSNS